MWVETLQHILPNIPDNGAINSWLPLVQNHEKWLEDTQDWMDEVLASTAHDLSVWSSSSLRRGHPRSSVPLVLTRHSSPILNKQWTCVINLSMFLLCYSLTITLRSQALHRVLLRWFNAPDALICYPASIEKLKLLGATYLPAYLPRCCNGFWDFEKLGGSLANAFEFATKNLNRISDAALITWLCCPYCNL
jgi:hypothetical protein